MENQDAPVGSGIDFAQYLAEEETRRSIAESEVVEGYIRSLRDKWHPTTGDDVRTAVAGNLRGFWEWLCDNGYITVAFSRFEVSPAFRARYHKAIEQVTRGRVHLPDVANLHNVMNGLFDEAFRAGVESARSTPTSAGGGDA